jgi:hypothetical protein
VGGGDDDRPCDGVVDDVDGGCDCCRLIAVAAVGQNPRTRICNKKNSALAFVSIVKNSSGLEKL